MAPPTQLPPQSPLTPPAAALLTVVKFLSYFCLPQKHLQWLHALSEATAASREPPAAGTPATVLVGGPCLPARSKGADTGPSPGIAFPCPQPSGLTSHHTTPHHGSWRTYGRSLLLGGLCREASHVVDDGGEVGGSVEADVGQAGRVRLDNALHTFRESREPGITVRPSSGPPGVPPSTTSQCRG